MPEQCQERMPEQCQERMSRTTIRVEAGFPFDIATNQRKIKHDPLLNGSCSMPAKKNGRVATAVVIAAQFSLSDYFSR
jgi:hypothetical protein